jgi:hypothetical protein
MMETATVFLNVANKTHLYSNIVTVFAPDSQRNAIY